MFFLLSIDWIKEGLTKNDDTAVVIVQIVHLTDSVGNSLAMNPIETYGTHVDATYRQY
jgi:hypothetical protein